ncbi:MAG: transglycosylase domain-containing protein [Saprospiraceae bacterium]|nr:transglycosylase domain-containing protein [Saprospiraceae bacterium]
MKDLDKKNKGTDYNEVGFLKAAFNAVTGRLRLIQDKWNRSILPITKSWEVYSQKNPREAFIFKWLFRGMLSIVLLVSLLILLVFFGVFGRIPDREDLMNIETANASEVYSSDNVLIGKYYTENRTNIELDSISPYLITALLAIEDKRFFEHSGIDLRSWLRVFKGIATNTQGLGGGSTLPQQLAKNLYPRKNYRVPGLSILINKIRENIVSIRLESIYNKEQLLIMYLNTVPFGGNRFGVQEASRYFYGIKPGQLTADQAATLIGMLKATTALDPTRNPKNSEKRRNLVLSQMLRNKDFRFESEDMSTISRMVTEGAIDEEQYERLISQPLTARVHEDIGNNDGLATYFREYIRTRVLPGLVKNLTKEDGSNYNIYTDGLKITTTLDSKMQKFAEQAVFKHLSYLQKEFYNHWKGYKGEKPWGDDKWIDEQVKRSERYNLLKDSGMDEDSISKVFEIPVPMKIFGWDKIPVELDTMLTPLDSVRYYFTMLNCGFMAMDFKTGNIKAWVGGTDFRYFKYDHILSKRQVGSTFKPIVYAAAIQDSITPCKFIRNDQVTIKDWTPRNSDESYGGWYSVIGGLVYSANVIAAQLIEKVGIQKTIDLATKMGVTTNLPREFGISLGAADIPLFDMMKVFGTIANNGVRPEPVSILKIEDRNGKIIYEYDQQMEINTGIQTQVRALSELEAATVSRMMQAVITSGTGNKLRSQYVPHGEFAGKTGTTQNHSDGWFIAFNPSLVTGAWVGGPSPAVRFKSMALGSGAAMALPIVGNFWYSLAIDKNFAKITQEKFVVNETANASTACPYRIGISPDTFNLLMQDTLLKDSLVRSGFRNLQQIVIDKYGYPDMEEPEGGESDGLPEGTLPLIEAVSETNESQKADSKKQKTTETTEKKKDEVKKEKKKEEDKKEKSKDPPGKGNI